MKFLLSLIAFLFLAGCGKDGGMLDLSNAINKSTGETVTKISGQISDVSAIKTAIHYHAWENRDNKYADMYKVSGLKTDWKQVIERTTVIIDGKIVTLEQTRHLPTIEYRDAPRFDRPLPDGPPPHEVWKFLTTVAEGSFELGKWFIGADLIDKVWQRSAPQYNGPYNNNSFNPSTTNTTTQIPYGP